MLLVIATPVNKEEIEDVGGSERGSLFSINPGNAGKSSWVPEACCYQLFPIL